MGCLRSTVSRRLRNTHTGHPGESRSEDILASFFVTDAVTEHRIKRNKVMFTKPIDEITFEDVETFCKSWPEGVRVEYKREVAEIKGKIPTIVSSFANSYGGIFFIGVKADKTKNKVIFPIQGITKTPGIDEQIHQSAIEMINPGVIPEVKIIDVPDSENIVVMVRVDESVQSPHAIENSTKVYIRVGSINEPYEYKLADMDRITYMFKRRENSQLVAEQILQRINSRAKRVMELNECTITVIAQPIFPHRPVISTSDIYELQNMEPWPPRRVAGGVSCFNQVAFSELNEYGIAYHRTALISSIAGDIEYGNFIQHIYYLISNARDLYKKCEYIGNIEVTAQLLDVYGKELTDSVNRGSESKITDNIPDDSKCFDSRVFASKQCLSHDLENADKRMGIVEELTRQLTWAFGIPINEPNVRKRVRDRIISEDERAWKE